MVRFSHNNHHRLREAGDGIAFITDPDGSWVEIISAQQ
jgi:hypothetical protein